MRALLDVNVLIALLDAGHLHHERAMSWLAREATHGWASCPITQNGCLRILSQPGYPNPLPVAAVAERLAEATTHPAHAFWPDDVSLLDTGVLAWQLMMGHRQVTDAYLLHLAVRNEGRFVTFDQRITVDLVSDATPAHLVILA